MMRALVLAAALLVFGIGAAFAQLLPQQQGADAPATTSPTRTITTGAPGCYDVFVEVVDEHPTGGNWDIFGGTRNNPDPEIKEASSGAEASCDDTFSCSMRIPNAGKTLSFTIMDVDFPSADDLIGEGQCTAGAKSCRVGRAKVSMSAC